MQIVLGNEVKNISEKYTVLELDQLRMTPDQEPITAYCVIDNEKIPITEVFQLEQIQDLHHSLIKNYKLKNWQFCEQMVNHLKGKFRGELDSFYETLLRRINNYKQNDPGNEWNGVVDCF